MKRESDMPDDLRPEYDLRKLKVRRIGPGRGSFAGVVAALEPDGIVQKDSLPRPTGGEPHRNESELT